MGHPFFRPMAGILMTGSEFLVSSGQISNSMPQQNLQDPSARDLGKEEEIADGTAYGKTCKKKIHRFEWCVG